MVNLNNITKSYNGNYKAVDNLNLEIKDGEIFGLLGLMVRGKQQLLR